MKENRASDNTYVMSAQGPRGDARCNWVWLVDMARWDDLLVITETPAIDSVARGWFRRTETTSPDEFLAERGGVGKASEAAERARPFGERRFDCVFMGQPLTPCSLRDRALIYGSAAKVRDGGCLVAFVRNILWYRSPLLPCIRTDATVPWSLQRLGFRRVVSYYAIPTPDSPTDLIPATRSAVSAYYRIHADGARMELTKRWLAHAGLHRLQFAFYLKLAYR